MSDPILFWTLFAVITANIFILVSAFMRGMGSQEAPHRRRANLASYCHSTN